MPEIPSRSQPPLLLCSSSQGALSVESAGASLGNFTLEGVLDSLGVGVEPPTNRASCHSIVDPATADERGAGADSTQFLECTLASTLAAGEVAAQARVLGVKAMPSTVYESDVAGLP